MSRHSSHAEISATTRLISNPSVSKVESSVSAEQSQAENPRIEKADIKCIVVLLGLVSIPLIVFSVVILWLVFHFRIFPSSSPLSDLQTVPNESDKSYYYVNFSATRLIFIASWSSSIAPMLVAFIMTLSLFPISKALFRLFQSGHTKQLPTPYQV
jgi:hypothetical protein